jgi:hypothetical protein
VCERGRREPDLPDRVPVHEMRMRGQRRACRRPQRPGGGPYRLRRRGARGRPARASPALVRAGSRLSAPCRPRHRDPRASSASASRTVTGTRTAGDSAPPPPSRSPLSGLRGTVARPRRRAVHRAVGQAGYTSNDASLCPRYRLRLHASCPFVRKTFTSLYAGSSPGLGSSPSLGRAPGVRERAAPCAHPARPPLHPVKLCHARPAVHAARLSFTAVPSPRTPSGSTRLPARETKTVLSDLSGRALSLA